MISSKTYVCLVILSVFIQIVLSQKPTCNVLGDVVFVIDGSDSFSDADFVRLKSFVAIVIDNLEININAIHVGMVVYSTVVSETIGLTPPKNKMVLKFLAANLEHPKFSTDTAAGMEAGRQMISDQGRPQAPATIVIITDGRSDNPENTIEQASQAKAQGITMIAIGVGNDIDSEELKKIASTPAHVKDLTDFGSLLNDQTVLTTSNLICKSLKKQQRQRQQRHINPCRRPVLNVTHNLIADAAINKQPKGLNQEGLTEIAPV